VLISALQAAGWRDVGYANAGRDNAAVEDSVPGTPGTGVDALIDGAGDPDILANPLLVGSVLTNWGVNDMNAFGSLVEATWESQYESIITYTHGRFANSRFLLSYPWRVGFDSEAATMHGWVDVVIAWCATQSIQCKAGVDEAVTIKGSDNGFSETDESTGGVGVHYSVPLGVNLYANAMSGLLP
jgi:hypothetical protein